MWAFSLVSVLWHGPGCRVQGSGFRVWCLVLRGLVPYVRAGLLGALGAHSLLPRSAVSRVWCGQIQVRHDRGAVRTSWRQAAPRRMGSTWGWACVQNCTKSLDAGAALAPLYQTLSWGRVSPPSTLCSPPHSLAHSVARSFVSRSFPSLLRNARCSHVEHPSCAVHSQAGGCPA